MSLQKIIYNTKQEIVDLKFQYIFENALICLLNERTINMMSTKS